MTNEMPEIFKALLDHPFTIPGFVDDGKDYSENSVLLLLCLHSCSQNVHVAYNTCAYLMDNLVVVVVVVVVVIALNDHGKCIR